MLFQMQLMFAKLSNLYGMQVWQQISKKINAGEIVHNALQHLFCTGEHSISFEFGARISTASPRTAVNPTEIDVYMVCGC